MKLRNKKTGEHGDYKVISAGNLIRVRDCESDESWQYDCLASFNANWEDYKSVEPLIKDEKVRKAVKAWAEACEISSALVYHSIFDTLLTLQSDVKVISFQVETPKELKFGKIYTIAELCGEEEE